jgi:catechol 2,3-dioxygenase-like lactoylglutathione lyase family enzyme
MAITGVHALFYSSAPDELRATLRDAFGWDNVDIGGGWLIFRLPPAELGVHPGEAPHHELSFMCDDLDTTMSDLRAKGIEFRGAVEERRFGRAVTMVLRGGVEVLLYQPSHPTAI